jgi:hypothetical protein
VPFAASYTCDILLIPNVPINQFFGFSFVGLPVCRFVGLSVCRFVGLSVCRFVGLSVCRFVGLSVCRFVGLSVCRFLFLYCMLSFHTKIGYFGSQTFYVHLLIWLN